MSFTIASVGTHIDSARRMSRSRNSGSRLFQAM
jgi:hypothetical protein